MGEPLKKNYYCTPLKHRGHAASGIDRRTHDGTWKVRGGAIAIMLNKGDEIRHIPLKPRDEIGAWNAINEIRALKGEGFTIIVFKKNFIYMESSQYTKWAMVEYTFHPPESGQENRYALCYVYKTKQDGRQGNGNGNGRVNPQQPTDHHVGGGSSISAPPFEVFDRPEEESLLEMYLRTWPSDAGNQ